MLLDAEAFRALLSFLEKAIAAGVGAWAAFRFQAYRETRKEHGERVHALRETLFVFSSQRGFLLNLESQQLRPLRDEPERHLLLRPALVGFPRLRLDLSKLVFLIKLHKSGSLISELDVAGARFETVLAVLEARNRLHYSMQARLETAGSPGGPVESDALSRLVGRPLVLQLRQMTDELYRSVDDALAVNRACVAAVQEFLKKAFPRERVPRVIEDGDHA